MQIRNSLMSQYIMEFPELIRWAVDTFSRIMAENSLPFRRIQEVWMAGMGGSGTALSLVATLLEDIVPFSVRVWKRAEFSRDFFVRAELRRLPILVSYSGNTREVLQIAHVLLQYQFPFIAITGGGQLEKISAEYPGILRFPLPRNHLPRTTFPAQLALLWLILEQVSRLADREATERGLGGEHAKHTLLKISRELRQQESRMISLARQIAEAIWNALDSTPCTVILLVDEWMSGVGLRWVQQWNENAKLPLHLEVFPECAHNFVEVLSQRRIRLLLLVLESAKASGLYQQFVNYIEETGQDHHRIFRIRAADFPGLSGESSSGVPSALQSTYLGNAYLFAWLGDWISLFLAEFQKIPPEPVPIIERWKERLNRL